MAGCHFSAPPSTRRRALPREASSRWKATESLKCRQNWFDFSTRRWSFFEDVLYSSQAQPNSENIKKDGIAYGSYLGNYADCEKRHKWRLGVRRSARFVRWMRLCEARARFSNRSS